MLPTAYAATGGTGYKIMEDSTNKLVITAPQAEIDNFIAIGTTTLNSTPALTYSVTYDGNTNTGGVAPTDANAYNEDDLVTVLDNTGSLTKTNYIFAGWNTLANASGIDRTPDLTFAIGVENVILYAKWVASLSYVDKIGTQGSGNDQFYVHGITTDGTYLYI
jgi:uncharacterized repeat protein (TIGR02543 family)